MRPTIKLEEEIKVLRETGELTNEVSNWVEDVCEVTFLRIDRANAVQMDPVTGAVPAGHELFGLKPNRVQPPAHCKKLLLRRAAPGDYGVETPVGHE